jgi:hypothetical protein
MRNRFAVSSKTPCSFPAHKLPDSDVHEGHTRLEGPPISSNDTKD